MTVYRVILALLFMTSGVVPSVALAVPQAGIFPYIYNIQGEAVPGSQVNSANLKWEILPPLPQYSGVGQLSIDKKVCSAAWIDVGGGDNSPVYVLTAGHCFPAQTKSGILAPYHFAINAQLEPGRHSMTFNYFKDESARRKTYDVKSWVYATTTETDLALVELNVSRAQLRSEGIVPLQLASETAKPGVDIEAVGIPMGAVYSENNEDRVTRVEERVLHREKCKIASIAHPTLTWADKPLEHSLINQLLYNCSSVGGNSGGPILSQKDGKVLGVVSGAKDLNNVISVNFSADQVRGMPLYNFGSEATILRSCIKMNGTFEPLQPGCQLPSLITPGQRCQMGVGAGCFDAAKSAETSASQAALLKQGCDLNDGRSCGFLAERYWLGSGVLQSNEYALNLFKKACALNDRVGCAYLANHYKVGAGVPVSLMSSAKYNRMACHMGQFSSCFEFGTALMEGEGVSKSVSLARQYVAWACSHKVPESCELLSSGKLETVNNP